MTEFVGIDQAEVDGVREALAKGDTKLATSLVSEKSVDSFKPWGTPDDIIEKVSNLMNTGLPGLIFGSAKGLKVLKVTNWLGRKVWPSLPVGYLRLSLLVPR